MAFTVAAVVAAAGSNVDAQSYVTASGTPTAGRKWYADVVTQNTTSAAELASLSGMGLTWAVVASVLHGGASANSRRLIRFEGTGTPSTGAVTITVDGANNIGCEWEIWEIGASGAVSAVQTATDSEASAVATHTVNTLAALGDAANVVVATFSCLVNSAIADNWTSTVLSQMNQGTPGNAIITLHKVNSNAPSATITPATDRWGSISTEFNEAGVVTGTSAVSFGFSLAGTGSEEFTGTSTVAFGFNESGSGVVEATGTSAAAFGFSESGSGKFADAIGSGGVAFGFLLAGTGQEEFTGTAAVAFGFSLSGTGQFAAALVGTMGARGDIIARLSFVGAGMGIEVEVYDSSFNPPRLIHLLDAARDVGWQDVLNDLGAGQFRIPATDRKAGERVIAKGNIVKMRLHGAARFPWKIEQIGRVYASTDGDAGEWLAVSGRSAEVLMEGARVASPDRSLTGFIAVILSDLIAEASSASRPILSAITAGWTATQDTGGTAWDDRATWEIPWGSTTVLDVWRQAVAMGIEFRLTAALTLQAYEAGLGTHLEDYIVFRPGRHLREQIEFASSDGAWLNRVYVKGSGGADRTVYGNHAERRRGIREGFVEFGATNEPAALERVGLAAIAASEAQAQSFRLPVHHGLGPGDWEPYLDYRKGDWTGLAVLGLPTPIRIVGISIASTGSNDYLVDLDVNAVRLDNMVRLKKLIESNANRLISIAGL